MARSERYDFENGRGEKLSGRLERPDQGGKAQAVFAHCFTCSKDIAAASRISRALRDRGLSVLRFDFTGLGNSDGDFGNEGFRSNVADLVAAGRSLEETHAAPSLLVGHSLGGAAVLAAAVQLESVKAVATIGAPSDPGHVRRLFTEAEARIEEEGSAEVELGGRTFLISRDFLEDLKAESFDEKLKALRRPLLIYHSPIDQVVGIEHARKIFDTATGPRSFLSLHDADHLLTDRADTDYVATTLVAWAGRYLDLD